MIFRIKTQGLRSERQFDYFKLSLFSFFFFLFSLNFFSQDSIPVAKDLTEEKELKFQQFFFKALSEKAITNYQKAIENLEDCNQVLPNNVSVFFEFSKNYLLLNNTLLAKEYIDRALAQEPQNIWMLLHLVEIQKKNNNYKEAIEVQKKVIKINPKKESDLVYLYLLNNEDEKAISLINKLEKTQGLSSGLKRLKARLESRIPDLIVKTVEANNIQEFVENFEETKSFSSLEKLLKKASEENDQELLLKYSNQGISLFPAQPFVYLINGKTLNNQKLYKKALLVLESGIDFVIEDKMEADFYDEMAISSEGIGNKNAAKKYRDRARKLKI